MKQNFLTLFLAVMLLLLNSTVLLADDFSISGDFSLSDRCHLEFNSYVYDPLVIYGDVFRYEDHDAKYTALLVGVDYFFLPFTEYDGFYIGAGFPLVRDISNNNFHMQRDLGPAYESGVEFRYGLRCRPFSDLPILMGLEYSNIKECCLNLGAYFYY
jgi:hypothetical protein